MYREYILNAYTRNDTRIETDELNLTKSIPSGCVFQMTLINYMTFDFICKIFSYICIAYIKKLHA